MAFQIVGITNARGSQSLTIQEGDTIVLTAAALPLQQRLAFLAGQMAAILNCTVTLTDTGSDEPETLT
jgi:hypothetical protein